MDIAKELVSVAKELTATSKSRVARMQLSKRLDNAERLIKAGGRGTELGIREIGMLAEGAMRLYKKMRSIQWDMREGNALNDALLEELEDMR